MHYYRYCASTHCAPLPELSSVALHRLFAPSSPGEKAEECTRSKSGPCEPDEGGVGLSLSATVNTVDVWVDIVFAVNTTVHDVVMSEVGAHRMRLIATAMERYSCRKSLMRAKY